MAACLVARIEIGEHSRICAAHFFASASAWPFGTTAVTKPSSYPSLADTWRPVSIMPMARFKPMVRGRR
jgi:hypothetical protein